MKTLKRYTLVLLASAVTLFSCEKDYDRVFSETAEARLQKALDEYNAQLQDAPYGWKASLITGTGIEYFYYLDFATDGKVSMLSDFNVNTAGTEQVATWELKALQTATLSFPTYSYIHMPADPKGSVNGGGDGVGQQSDVEFAFARATADSILLEGLQRGSHLTLVQATAEEKELVRKGRIKDILDYGLSGDGLELTLSGDRTITFVLNPDAKTLTAQYISDDGLQVEVTPRAYSVSMQGILLNNPIRAYGETIQELLWDDNVKRYYAKVGNASVPVVQNPNLHFFRPVIPIQDILGADYFAVLVPYGSVNKPIKGQSPLFTELYQAAAAELQTWEVPIELYDMFVAFDINTNTMYLVVRVVQSNTLFTAQYNYRYTLSGEGVYTFGSGTAVDDNAKALAAIMSNIFVYINGDSFKAEFVGGTEALTGGFFSQEHPEFSFSGILTN
ncbi:DUF4302 domain-containing protein [Fulvivirgaceae bacterium PWU5]|uniref:DUF4302 domain-containing protein n=1 Tax=Dawidia cretensis TaxID=2782350 RepID=A0AAP2E2H3_9BACT|nr:DUF4302 domain-containing protein [Dawidia cretensis]MBT1711878.1 DUF4302 domain-containing protein [Dawidia cretensis]